MSRKKEINSALWKRLEPLMPVVKPSPQGGRPRLDDDLALNGILFVLRTGIAWEDLPQELGFGSGMTCWRRLREWQAAGVWHQLHPMLLAELRGAGRLYFSRANIDGASVPSSRGARATSAMTGSGATAGWSNACTPGWRHSASCVCALIAASRPNLHCPAWLAASSAFDHCHSFVSNSKSPGLPTPRAMTGGAFRF